MLVRLPALLLLFNGLWVILFPRTVNPRLLVALELVAWGSVLAGIYADRKNTRVQHLFKHTRKSGRGGKAGHRKG